MFLCKSLSVKERRAIHFGILPLEICLLVFIFNLGLSQDRGWCVSMSDVIVAPTKPAILEKKQEKSVNCELPAV